MRKTILFSMYLLVQCYSFALAQDVTITRITRQSDALEVEVSLVNNTSNEILIVSSNPGEKINTSYFFTLDDKSKTIKIRRHFFLYPHHSVSDLVEPCFLLNRLSPGKSYDEKLVLGYPSAKNSYFDGAEFDISRYDFVSFQIGILPFDSFIEDIPKSRPFGHCADAQDKISGGIHKGKTLIEIQNILKTNPVKIKET